MDKDDPADVARQAFEAVLPDGGKAALHRRQAEPGTAPGAGRDEQS